MNSRGLNFSIKMSDELVSDSPLESPISSPTPEDDHCCPACQEKLKQPKVLSCLHVFCEPCLQKQVEENNNTETPNINKFIECEKCKHLTHVPEKGVGDLMPEYVLLDLMEMSAIEDMQIICTSCKAKEKAVARCQDCANFLCPNCVTAHQFMRCFENHKVASFDDLKNGDTSSIHKPIFCDSHPSENLKHYCTTCQVAICNDCIVGDHKPPEHRPERILDLEEAERDGFKSLITESKSKMATCEEATTTLQNALEELQGQRDNAKDLINETFQSYKAVLEKRKDEMLEEMETLHSNQELAIMELCHNVEKSVEKLEDGCKFTEHIVNNGSGLQLLLMKKQVSSYLIKQINNAPNPEVNINVEFKTDAAAFEVACKKHFGSFKKEENRLPERPLSSLHSSFENEGFSLHSGVLSPDTTLMPPPRLPDFMHQMSMPPMSMPGNIGDVNFQSLPPHGMPPMPGISHTILEGRSLSRNSHSPTMSDSGISVDAASTNSNSSAPLVNIAALAKLGTVGYSSQGQVTFNGQVVPGLNMNNITGMPPVSSRGPTPISESGITTTPRSNTPSLETLAGLLNQNCSVVGGLTNLQTNLGNLTSSGTMTPSPGSVTPTFSSASGLSDSNPSLNTIGSSSSSFSNFSQGGPPVRRGNKMSAMQIRCKFGQLGPGKGQFNSPHGFCLGVEEDIIVADTNNHRIQVFEKSGEFKYQFGIPGREEGQLWYPRKVAVMRNSGKYIVCDRGNERSRMQIFTKTGHFVKKIAIRYIDIVAGLAITQQGHIVAVDSVSPTVFCIADSGELIKWFDCSDYMREPSDIAISGKDYFVCDFKGHCVVVFNEEGLFQRRIGCENITNYPNGIDISDAGDVLVGDSHGNRFHVAVFQRDGSLIGEFECPYVKVSRCCGLKITSEGYVVTLAKNNHHVLVLNTLYIS